MEQKKIKDALYEIEDLIFKDPGNRGIKKCFEHGCLYESASKILKTDKSKKSYILTGFCCMHKTCETDGPLGSSILSELLRFMKYDTSLLCDSPAKFVVEASSITSPVLVVDDPNEINRENIGFIVSIERPGRAEKTNDYRTCRARDISDVTYPLDLLFPNIKDNKQTDYLTISVGDGGNEVGTGNIINIIKRDVPMGEDICTISSCEVLIMAGVSNWGGLAIAAALSLLSNDINVAKKLIELFDMQKDILEKMIKAGSYDGISGEHIHKIDGMKFEEEHSVLNKNIIQIIKKYYNI